ncbi:DsbA family protein [Devosia sp. WQ 349]|uniref:DsbA family protein n=1 Tax=Devosia sp. WQ 349K1 TaxID=2800329 RepID=UPI001906ED1B|nr:DsbA family protein [Devosia sp. WQ 349K1]MBK1792907.1 DsbA family protein [Devosia sp. WQ 349K1]
MARTTITLTALAGVLAGALGWAVIDRPSAALPEADLRAVVESVVTAKLADALPAPQVLSPPPLDAGFLNPMIEDYLMQNPTVLRRMVANLEATERTEAMAKAEEGLAANADLIYNAPNQVVLGNPDGDVTLVEFFDYNCGYCRKAMPDLVTLMAEDPNLRVILKELPILSDDSVDAARIGVLVAESDADYWTFHEALYTARGKVTKDTAIAAARGLGLSPVDLELRMKDESVATVLQDSYKVAQALGISGTPAYIIGNEIIPGAIGVDALRERIANMRECGKAQCV